jgi:hypothetical protein
MSSEHNTGEPLGHLHRRSFLRTSGAITAMAFVGVGTLSSTARADALTKAQRDKLSQRLHRQAGEL